MSVKNQLHVIYDGRSAVMMVAANDPYQIDTRGSKMFRFENSQLHCSTCGSYLIELICRECDGRGRKQTLAGERPCPHCQGNGFSRQCVLGHPQEENRRAAQMIARFA